MLKCTGQAFKLTKAGWRAYRDSQDGTKRVHRVRTGYASMQVSVRRLTRARTCVPCLCLWKAGNGWVGCCWGLSKKQNLAVKVFTHYAVGLRG